jgi:hypothetical protein
VSAVGVAGVRRAVEDLWHAVAELVLTANDDQPEQGDLAAAEHVAEVVVELQGRLAQAREALAAGPEALPEVDRCLREAGLLYWRDLRAHGPVSRLRGSTRRRGGDWPSWWFGVEQSVARCEEPLTVADQALGAAWQELAAASLTGTTRSDILRRSS